MTRTAWVGFATTVVLLGTPVSALSQDQTPARFSVAVRFDQRSAEVLQQIVCGETCKPEAVAAALEALALREVTPDCTALERCLRSHRRRVREAAALHATRAGIPIPPAPEGAAYFQTKGGAQVLENLSRRIGVPLDRAEWVEIETFGEDEETDMRELPVTDRGWLLKETSDAIEIETPNGYVKRISSSERLRNQIVRHRHRRVDVGREVERVVALRAKMNVPESRPRAVGMTVEVRSSESPRDRFDLRVELSDCGTLSSQFEPFGCSLYEVMLAYRVLQVGRRDDAARLLMPLVDATPDDEAFDELVQKQLGIPLFHQMVARFCEHDLDQALVLARRVQSDLPLSRFAELAGRMAAEIPRRCGDWTDFRLPTAEEWRLLSARLDRDSQIRFLCERVRLVTAVGSGLGPGRRSPEWAPQTREPGRADHRATFVHGGSISVINPLHVLSKGPLGPRPDGSGAQGADAQDVPLLKSCAAEDWLCPCVHAWRYFAAPRAVSTTSELLGSLIDGLKR